MLAYNTRLFKPTKSATNTRLFKPIKSASLQPDSLSYLESGSLWQSQCYNHSAQLHVHQRIVSYLNSAVPLLTNTHLVTHPPHKPQSQPAWCNTHFALTGIKLLIWMSSCPQPSYRFMHICYYCVCNPAE